MIATFEALRDTVDAMPYDLINEVMALRETIGAARYEQLLIASIQSVGRPYLPNTSAEFIRGFQLLVASDPPSYTFPGER